MAEYRGIDVSKHQGQINWQAVKASGIAFAIIRAGYGHYDTQKDEKFETNYKNAKAAGVPVGAYLYSYAKSVEDAKAEAKVFLNWLSGKQFEMPVVYDVEEKTQSAKGKQFVSDIIRAFCETIENAGYYVAVYANKNWYENYIDDDCKKKYDCWLAQWADKPTYNGNIGIWQYTSDGSVNGISGRVDMNVAYKDYPSIIKPKGFNGFSGTQTTGVTPAPVTKVYSKGQAITLTNAALYASSTTSKVSKKVNGTYYVYDGEKINGRYRITNALSKCGKKPTALYVTGWVAL